MDPRSGRKRQTKPKTKRVDGLRVQYRFDYTKSKLNRFAKHSRPEANEASSG